MIGKDLRRNTKKKSSFFFCNTYAISGGSEKPEKVAYANAVNCVCNDLRKCAVEMTATASVNRQVKFPVLHMLLSWREGEHPTNEQVDEAVKITLEELGLTGHQCVYGLHQNTNNYHLHLSINKVNPETFKSVDPNHGWTQKAMEHSARRIEFLQGWEVENNQWSYVDKDDGMIKENAAEVRHDDDKRTIPAKIQDQENKYGEKSAVRVAQEKLLPLIKTATTWDQVHSRLARFDARYEQKGSGAVIIIGDVTIKASSVSKCCALKKMQEKLGEFSPAVSSSLSKSKTAAHHTEPVRDAENNSDWQKYIDQKQKYMQYRNKVKKELEEEYQNKFLDLKKKQKEEREELKQINWKKKGKIRNAYRSVLAAKQAAERVEFMEEKKQKKIDLANEYPAFLSFEAWLREYGKNKEADFWRYRRELHKVNNSNTMRGYPEKDVPPAAQDIRTFKAVFSKDKTQVFYVDTTNPTKVSFRDTGRKIYLNDKEEKTILASLQLAQAKWGGVKLSGSEDYINKCIELAVKNKIKIANPELQDKIKTVEENERKMKREAPVREQLDAFRIYEKAVNADNYKVTATEFFEDGNRRGFMVNKKDGFPDGYTAEDLESSMNRLVNLKNSGRNIYYTPISKDKYHLLVDDLSAESIAEMMSDGFKPAIIIESSPGNYQAILTTDKLKTEHDREIGNAIVKELNKKYGDPKVSGEIHAHRAPAFDNRKPKHKKEDGTYPQVKIIEAKGGKCDKCAEKIKEIAEKIKQREANKPQIYIETDSNKDTASAYIKHFNNIMQLQKTKGIENSEIDASRIDAMICVRLRATGHTAQAITEVCEKAAPEIRKQLGSKGIHEWKSYAKRSVEYAFSTKGDIQIQTYKNFIPQWEKIEGGKVQKTASGNYSKNTENKKEIAHEEGR